MNTRAQIVSAISLCLGIASGLAQEEMTGAQLYQQACASCHGAQLQGGNAQSLVDGVWQFGAKDSYIFRNIKYGIPDFSMPAFERALTDRQINRIVAYLLEAEKTSGIRKPPPPTKLFTLDYEIKVDVIAQNLDIPWAIDFLDARTAVLTERPGRLRLMVDHQMQPDPIKGTPAVVHEGQGGLLDVAVDPEYAKNGWIYLAYSHALDEPGKERPPAMTRIVRGKLRDNTWTSEQVVYEAPKYLYLETRHHYGCRIVFDPAGFLYFSIGERGIADHAQNLMRPNGKVHRIHRDGTPPADNPFSGRTGALQTIFTYGNRNPQGLAVHPVTGVVWETEHGPMGGDELNQLVAGRNYGWPIVTYGRNYDGGIISDVREKPGMESPAVYWKPSIAACGIDFVRGSLFARWKNQLLVGALKYEELRLLDIQADRVLHQQIILKNAGRVRDVACGPDGAIYAVLNGPDMVLRLTPIRDLNVNTEDAISGN